MYIDRMSAIVLALLIVVFQTWNRVTGSLVWPGVWPGFSMFSRCYMIIQSDCKLLQKAPPRLHYGLLWCCWLVEVKSIIIPIIITLFCDMLIESWLLVSRSVQLIWLLRHMKLWFWD